MSEFSLKPFPCGDKVTNAFTKFLTRYWPSGVPAPDVAQALDLFPSQPVPAGFTPQKTWKDPWPFNDRAGVYLIYSAEFDLLYVGTAQYLGARLSGHFGSGKDCVPRGKWSKPPRFVISIAVPEDVPFEAPALEGFLIGELGPPDNFKGK